MVVENWQCRGRSADGSAFKKAFYAGSWLGSSGAEGVDSGGEDRGDWNGLLRRDFGWHRCVHDLGKMLFGTVELCGGLGGLNGGLRFTSDLELCVEGLILLHLQDLALGVLGGLQRGHAVGENRFMLLDHGIAADWADGFLIGA